tara:strand:- start:385 stop:606 length:222 start_codon:yes stop_codon:yes gene_type:complete
MIFKIGDVLGYNNGYHAIITDINNDDIDLDLSDGSRFIIKKSKLINGIAAGNIKFNSFSGNIKPPKFIKPFDF